MLGPNRHTEFGGSQAVPLQPAHTTDWFREFPWSIRWCLVVNHDVVVAFHWIESDASCHQKVIYIALPLGKLSKCIVQFSLWVMEAWRKRLMSVIALIIINISAENFWINLNLQTTAICQFSFLKGCNDI